MKGNGEWGGIELGGGEWGLGSSGSDSWRNEECGVGVQLGKWELGVWVVGRWRSEND